MYLNLLWLIKENTQRFPHSAPVLHFFLTSLEKIPRELRGPRCNQSSVYDNGITQNVFTKKHTLFAKAMPLTSLPYPLYYTY